MARQDAPCAVLNDLAVLEISRASKEPELLLEALEHLDKAKEDASCPEASLNFARLAEILGLWGTASKSWRQLATRTQNSWLADWARDRSTQLLAMRLGLNLPLDLFRERRRELESSLASWANALHHSDSSEAHRHGIVAADLARGCDPIYQSVLTDLQQQRPAPELIDGIVAFKRARGDSSYSRCSSDLLAADSLFAIAGTPYRAFTLIDRGVCAYFDRDFRKAETLVEQAVAIGQRLPSKVLLARTSFLLSLIRNQEGRFLEAEPLAARSQALFRELGEISEVDYAWGLRAKIAQAAGASQQAWRWRVRGLAARASVPSAERAFNLFEEARLAAEMDGELPLGVRFLEEQDIAARRARSRSPDLEIFSAVDGGSLFLALGDVEKARQLLKRGREQWEHLPAGNESREHQRHDLAVLSTSLPGASDQARLTALTAAQGFFGQDPGGDQAEVLRLHRLKAEVHVAAGSLSSALVEIDRGLEAAERQNLDGVDALQRALLSSRTRDLVDLGVDLELRQGKIEEALVRLEEGSQKVLRSGLIGSISIRQAITQAQRSDRTILRYAVLPDRLVIWTLGTSQIQMEERAVSAAEVRKEVAICRTVLEQARKISELEPCQRISDLVLPSGLAELATDARWTLIPDDELHELPFAGLPIGSSGQLLLERAIVSYAPSIGALATTTAEPRPLKRALIVANPAFDEAIFPLRNLKAAEESAFQVASAFEFPQILTRKGATKRNVLKGLQNAELFYFAGHGLGREAPGEQGGLLLAPDPEKKVDLEALLTASDLPSGILPSLRMVVLASCRQSAFDTAYGAREQLGLASAFLARGARSVLLSSWPIDDLEAAEFFVAFAKELALHPDTAASLRTTQLHWITSNKPISANIGYKFLER